MKLMNVFDRLPINYQDTVMYIDPKTRQSFKYASSISYDINAQNVTALDFAEINTLYWQVNLYYELPQISLNQNMVKEGPNTFTAQEAGTFSNAELNYF